MIVYTLNVTNIKTQSVGDRADVVVWVGWELVADNGEKTISFIGQSIWDAPGEQFTPFELLTEAQVKSWVEAVEPLDAHKISLEQQFSFNVQTPEVETKALPWQ